MVVPYVVVAIVAIQVDAEFDEEPEAIGAATKAALELQGLEVSIMSVTPEEDI